MRLYAAISGLALLLCIPAGAHAQAYVDPPNSLSVGFAYTYAPSGKIIAETGGLEVPATDMFIHVFIPSVQYVLPVEGLAFEAELPMMGVKLGSNDFDHFPVNGPYDDGNFHFTPLDLRAGFRYQIAPIADYLGVAFVLAGSVPTRDYPTQGLSAPGHHLKALYGGVSIGRTFDPLLPNLFFQIDYQYALRERVKIDQSTEDLSRDYSEANVLLGYFLPAGFSIAAGANSRFSHGGADFDTILFAPMSIQYYHDRLLDEDFILVGGNVGYDVTESFALGAGARFFVWGENTRNQNLFSIYASYKLF